MRSPQWRDIGFIALIVIIVGALGGIYVAEAADTMFLQTATGTTYIIRGCANAATDPARVAQTASGTGRTLNYFDVYLAAPNGASANLLTWSLQGVTNGTPNGVSYATGTINQSSLTNSAASYRIAMSPAYTMVSSTSYALVVSCQNTDNGAGYRVNFYGTSVSQYSLGAAWYYENPSGPWSLPDGNAFRDINISMYETYVTSTVTSTSTTTSTIDLTELIETSNQQILIGSMMMLLMFGGGAYWISTKTI